MGTPKGYIYAELDVSDPEMFYEQYMPAVRPILLEYGAKFLIASDDVRVIEGDRSVRRVILLEFDSPERASAFFYSKAYQDILDLRLRSSRAHLYHIDGVSGA